MKPSRDLECVDARGALSARLDAELDDERPLLAHLERCEPCRQHERGLAQLARGWQALRAVAPPADLWERIERRARARRPRSVPRALRVALANAAAALVGFAGLGLGVRWLEVVLAGAPRERHWLEHLAPEVLDRDPAALVAARPELQLLRTFPTTTPDEERR